MTPAVQIRAATQTDVDTMCDIFFASYNDLHRRHGLSEEDPADRAWLADAMRHVLATDPEGTVLAFDDGAPAAFAMSYVRDAYWFLSFLFVGPHAQGKGVGKSVLEAAMPDHERGTRALVVESFQPISTGLYSGYGITPRGVRYVLTAPPETGRLPDPPSDLVIEATTDAAIAEMSELDRRHLGFTRPDDHAWWLGSPGTIARTYRRGDALVGYAYVDDEGIVGPALGADEAALCTVVAELLRTAEHTEALKVPIYGNNAGLFRMLVRAGARIEDADYRYYYCSTDDALPPTYIHYAGYLA